MLYRKSIVLLRSKLFNKLKYEKISFLMLLALAFLLSCRTESLNEEISTANQSSQFHLISKKISLSESEHRVKLLSELEKAEANFKTFSKANSQGKIINYANGVSIDTDNVIYIEDGSGYHTYTFNIKQKGVDEDVPLENLVLSVLPDGSYKELLFSYNFTKQERLDVLAGNGVTTNGKTTVTELGEGTFGNPLGKMQCSYKTVDVVMSCYTGEHNSGNRSSWSQCQWKTAPDGFPPQQYTVTALVCGDDLTTDVGTYPGEGGGGGPLDGGGVPPGQIPTQPVVLSSFPIFVKNLQPDLKAIINTPANQEFYNVFLNYYNLCYESTESKEIIKWYLQAIQNNTFTTIEQIQPMLAFSQYFFSSYLDVTYTNFQNWFLDEPIILNNTLQNELFEDWADPTRVKPTTRFKNNTLVNCIYNKAKTAANFNQYLKNFDGRFSAAHLQFDLKSLPSIHNAETEPPVGYWIKININSNNLNRPTLDIARTFMHEIIHAEMFRILLSLAPTSNGEINSLTITQMLQNSDYPGLYDYFRRYGLNNMQHEQMAAHYRGIIKNFLKQIDNSFTEAEYDALAWQGLKGTERWNQLTTAQQQSIDLTFSTWNQSASHNCP